MDYERETARRERKERKKERRKEGRRRGGEGERGKEEVCIGSSLLAARRSPLAARAPARPNAARQLATRSPSLTLSGLRCADLQIPPAALLETVTALSRLVLLLSREEPVSPWPAEAQLKT